MGERYLTVDDKRKAAAHLTDGMVLFFNWVFRGLPLYQRLLGVSGPCHFKKVRIFLYFSHSWKLLRSRAMAPLTVGILSWEYFFHISMDRNPGTREMAFLKILIWCHLLLKTYQQVPTAFRLKIKICVVYRTLQELWLWAIVQPHYVSQGLCTCFSLCIKSIFLPLPLSS